MARAVAWAINGAGNMITIYQAERFCGVPHEPARPVVVTVQMYQRKVIPVCPR